MLSLVPYPLSPSPSASSLSSLDSVDDLELANEVSSATSDQASIPETKPSRVSGTTVTVKEVTQKRPGRQTRSQSDRPVVPSKSIQINVDRRPPATKKRKLKVVEDEENLSCGPPNRELKRKRSAPAVSRLSEANNSTTSGSTSRVSSRPPSPERIYRNSSSRSRSGSAFPHNPPIQRDWSCKDKIIDPVPAVSSKDVVLSLMKSYKAHFRNPQDPDDKSWEPHPTDYPVAELEYPNDGACEEFILLAPKDKDHYNPIMCLESSLYMIIEHYLTKEQRSLFGPLPNAILCDAQTPPSSPSLASDDSGDSDAPKPRKGRRKPTPKQQKDAERRKEKRERKLDSSSGEEDDAEDKNDPRYLALMKHFKREPGGPPTTNYLRSLQRAINLHDGPLFMKSLNVINSYLRFLKYPRLPDDPFARSSPNGLVSRVKKFTETGLPRNLLERILEENYQRSVGPNVPKLRKYEAFSSTVYGELMPSLAYEIIANSGLNENSIFVDLGSGVANVVVQASLQTGCYSFGVEIMGAAADVAQGSVENFERRCRMWGLNVGKMEVEKNDMVKSKRVDELIRQADVLLVDNKVFEESLNEALRPKFLDLKDNAIVVSLKPFVSSLNARVTERNVDDMSAIFDVTEKPYHSGSVSWGNGGGSYYIHRVDREGYAKIRTQFENSRGRSTPLGRTTRSRR